MIDPSRIIVEVEHDPHIDAVIVWGRVRAAVAVIVPERYDGSDPVQYERIQTAKDQVRRALSEHPERYVLNAMEHCQREQFQEEK